MSVLCIASKDGKYWRDLVVALYGAENWTLQKVDQEYLKSFEMCGWRRKEYIIWTDHVRN
jgi:hypothetical protein